MIGVDVGVERVHELQVELADQGDVALHLLEHGIDEDRLARLLVGEQVRVGRGLGIEELSEQHGFFS